MNAARSNNELLKEFARIMDLFDDDPDAAPLEFLSLIGDERRDAVDECCRAVCWMCKDGLAVINVDAKASASGEDEICHEADMGNGSLELVECLAAGIRSLPASGTPVEPQIGEMWMVTKVCKEHRGFEHVGKPWTFKADPALRCRGCTWERVLGSIAYGPETFTTPAVPPEMPERAPNGVFLDAVVKYKTRLGITATLDNPDLEAIELAVDHAYALAFRAGRDKQRAECVTIIKNFKWNETKADLIRRIQEAK